MSAGTTPEEWLRTAAELRDAGRVAEAIAAYRRALDLRPQAPNSWYNLARLQRQAGQPAAALDSYDEALRRGIAEPEEVHLNRGVIYADDLGSSESAEAELQRALAINPRYLPAWLNLGNLHEDRGDRDAARAAYERALAIEPGDAMTLARLAGVANLSARDDPLLDRLRRALAGHRDPAARADLGFALGSALDRVGAYDEAFAAYAAANQASRALGMGRYDRAAQERSVDRLIAAFPRAERRPPAGSADGEAPIFICGLFRSGSTLAEQILARHEAVTPGGELGLVPWIAGTLRPYPEAAAAAAPESIAGLRSAYLGALRKVHLGAGLVTDKRPDNFLHIGLIKRLFPEARIVHTVRDPLDNLLSLYFLHLDPAMAYAQDLEDAAHWYGQYRRLMAHWRRLYPDDIHDLDYDLLVADPKPRIEALLAFCGLPWRDACLSFHEADNAVRTASAGQVREPLYRRSSGRWRNYERHLGGLIEALKGL